MITPRGLQAAYQNAILFVRSPSAAPPSASPASLM